MVQGLVSVEVVLGFLAVEEGGRETVEGEFEVIVRVVELGGKGNHVLHGTAQMRLFHRFVDLLEHHLLLSGSGGNGERTLEEHDGQNNADNKSHCSFSFSFSS